MVTRQGRGTGLNNFTNILIQKGRTGEFLFSTPRIKLAGGAGKLRTQPTVEKIMNPVKVTILVNQRPFHLDKTTLSPEEFRALVSAPADYEVWRIVKNPDPEGQLPVDDIQITASVVVEDGQRFRVVPPGTFGY